VGAELKKLQPIVSEFKKAGLLIEAVDVGISSLIRAHQYSHTLKGNSIVLCYVGHTQSMLSVVNKDRILVYRQIPWGLLNLIKKLEEHLDLPSSQVMTILGKHGVSRMNRDTHAPASDGDLAEDVGFAVGKILAPYLEDFVYEFHNVSGYAISEMPDTTIKKAYFYGQASMIKGLDRYLENVLNTSVELVDPVEQVSDGKGLWVDGFPETGGFSLAFGLAMRKVPWL
jgi:Tfp pilus assembly PilM family ATPase